MSNKNDKEILESREEVYGPPRLFFEAYGRMCEVLDEYAHIGQGRKVNYGHISAMKMVLLKVLRSSWCPDVEDNYADTRNYASIAEMTTRTEEITEKDIQDLEDGDIWNGTERRGGIFDTAN